MVQNPNLINIEIAFALEEQQFILPLSVPYSFSVSDAIFFSNLHHKIPFDLAQHKVGIFGSIVPLNSPLREGDRIEIYRPLLIDPKKNRLVRAKLAKIKNK